MDNNVIHVVILKLSNPKHALSSVGPLISKINVFAIQPRVTSQLNIVEPTSIMLDIKSQARVLEKKMF